MNNTNALRMPESALPDKLSLAMAYVPFQYWEKPYTENIAFSRGTIFQSLDFPFIGEEAVPNENRR
ncbi:MAG: spore coat associated protein CotJA [Oscillospiraceae bacterium]